MNQGLFTRKVGDSIVSGRRGGLLNITYGKLIDVVEAVIKTMKNLSSNMYFILERINKA